MVLVSNRNYVMVSKILRNKLIFKNAITAALRLAVPVYKLATLISLLIVVKSSQSLACPSIYNMDPLLAEPYPFLSRQLKSELVSQSKN